MQEYAMTFREIEERTNKKERVKNTALILFVVVLFILFSWIDKPHKKTWTELTGQPEACAGMSACPL